MQQQTAPEILKLLAHDLRWQLLQSLMQGDKRVNELVDFIGEPANAVSYHLKQLREANIVTNRRSDADGRDIYYTINLDALHNAYLDIGESLHPALSNNHDEQISSQKTVRVLFLCTHNSARSQMAEGMLRANGGDNMQVFSAGSHPTTIHPDAIRAMDSFGINIRKQRSEHISNFLEQSFDYVITLCDYAREVCPVFDGSETKLHWGFSDPSRVKDDAARLEAFKHVARLLQSRVQYFVKTI